MTIINVFTENIYSGWEIDEKDIIEKIRIMLTHYIKTLGKKSCLNGYNYKTLTLDILFCDSQKTHELNREYRNIDKETDVLSFPSLEFEVPGDFSGISDTDDFCADFFNPDTGELMLGDMIISADKVKEQAAEYGHSETRELAFLVAHSMFHLFGYDHEESDEAEVMEAKQEAVLQRLGIGR